MTLSEELVWRGFVNQTTFKDNSVLDGDPIKFYFGVDPSADSMQIGNLAAAMMNRLFIKHGHKAYLLVGGATGLIGDPDGKAQERDLKTLEQIAKNKAGIAAQYHRIFSGTDFTVVDNYDWFKDIDYLTFLRDVGKHVPMRQMLGREFVQSRLSEDGAGISYAEFSYSLIQGYDFLHLHREHGVTLQLCGADQWGNSIAGVDLIRRVSGGEAHVWSLPLIINKATGKKFGKTEGGAVWLDENKTSVFQFYQFWINVDDDGVEDYMKIYTDLDKPTIDQVIAEHQADASKRVAQKRLAYEVTKLVHGEKNADSVKEVSRILFIERNYPELKIEHYKVLANELSTIEVEDGHSIVDALVELGLAKSKSEARRLIEQGSIKNNNYFTYTLSEATLTKSDAEGGYILIIKGSKKPALVKIV